MKKGFVGVISALAGAVFAGVTVARMKEKVNREQVKKTEKFRTYYNVLNQWMMLKQEGKSITEYFAQEGCHVIAIYGMGELGSRLLKELENTDIKVKYCMNTDAPTLDENMNTIAQDEQLEPVDAVVVTAMFAFDEIEERLSETMDCQVISLEDVVYGI